MDKIIVTVMLIIGGIIASLAIFNSIYPAVERSGAAINTASDIINQRIKSDIKIVQVNENGTTVDAWIKNTGSVIIDSVANSDIFFGVEGNFSRISYGEESSPLPYWNYQLEGSGSEWGPTYTNKISIHFADELTPDTYILKMFTPIGIYDETVFGVN